MIEPSNSGTAPRDPASPLWRFSLGFYARPGVSDACLALQDSCGADVNVLLFLLWLAHDRRVPAAEELEGILQNTRDWQVEVIAVLRDLRRKMKKGAYGALRDGAVSLRTKITALELEAEHMQQDHLHSLAADSGFGHDGGTAADAANVNLALYETALGCPFPTTTKEALLRALDTTS
jgi:uncharacterized protein (TIGR02444 family)